MPQAIDPPADDIASLVADLRRHDPDRFLTTLFAPPDQRDAYWALLAFNLEIAKVRETVSQPLLGQIRLQWWREVLDEIYQGSPVRRHVVATPLAAAVSLHGIARATLDAMIDGRERDLDDIPFPTIGALSTYAEATSGRLLLAMLDIAAVSVPDIRDAASRFGTAWALVGLIRAIPFHARTGKDFIPTEIAEFTGLAQEQHGASRPSPPVSGSAALMASEARDWLAKGIALVGRHPPKAALPVLLVGRLTGIYLGRLQRVDYDPYDSRAQMRDPLAALKLTLAYWRRRI